MFDVIRKVLAFLSPKERKQAYLLLGMILVMAFLDVVGIASIMPFMAVLANPGVIESNTWLNSIYTSLEFTDPQSFLFLLGGVVFIALVASTLFKAVTTWAIARFAEMRNYTISRRLVEGYLGRSYEWFLGRHSADIGQTVLSEVQQVVQGALLPTMQICANATVVAAILLLLIAVDPVLAVVVAAGFGGAYGLAYLSLRKIIDRAGKTRFAANQSRFKVISEVFGGIKEVKLGGLETAALKRFDVPAMQFARSRVIVQVVGEMPRYALEIIAFGGILLLILVLMRSGHGLQAVLPVIALYALAGYRMMPALQVTYQKATSLRFSGEALDRLVRDIQEEGTGGGSESVSLDILAPKRTIKLANACYSYPRTDTPAVRDISLIISVPSTVGFVGATGSGKTSIADIILGLLELDSGRLEADDVLITSKNRRSWQRSLGFVPQQIFLADETVSGNIAFGVPKDEIDQVAVERAAKIANLHDFIVDELLNGYDTLVGERGIRLSGGQRQRIGIARALYNEPKVLVLDEATSALDNLTEQAVMDAVHNLEGEITIILIAHRLNTVRECDRIFVLERGRLVGEGTYDELNATNERFRAIASVGSK